MLLQRRGLSRNTTLTCQADWSILTMDYARECDWPMGDVHMMGTLLLVGTEEGLHG